MDWNRVEGNWKQIKGGVKEKWGKLTDDDLNVINGRRDQLEGKFRSDTASRKIKSKRISTTGTALKSGEGEHIARETSCNCGRVSLEPDCNMRVV